MKPFISCSTVARLLLLLSIPGTMLIDPIGGQPAASSSNGHHQHRRSPMGFHGVRGKRSPESVGAINLQQPPYYSDASATTNQGGSVLAAQSVVEATQGTLIAPGQSVSEGHVSLAKRASRGFFGMRGKKDYEQMENTLPFDSPEQEDEIHGDQPEQQLEKRLKTFPVRYTISPQNTPAPTTARDDSDIMVIGKLVEDRNDLLENKDRDTRLRFYHIVYHNGESDLELPSESGDQELSEGSQNTNGRLVPGRGQREHGDSNGFLVRYPLQWMIKNNLPESEDDDDDDITIGRYTHEQSFDLQEPRNKKLFFNLPYRFIPKRAPNGFMGMRGKKFLETSNKRGPSGFFGMRGKKSSSPYGDLFRHPEPNYFEDDFENEVEKRAPATGFLGVRGKKENYYGAQFNDIEGVKRSPKMGFHGMRGKRSVDFNNGMFSVIKNIPYELRSAPLHPPKRLLLI